MPDCVLALDVGGTSVKLALIGSDGQPLDGTTGKIDVQSGGTREEILDAFLTAASYGFRLAGKAGYALCGCGVAFPGPFDYVNGISRMSHKMQAIKDVPLTSVFQKVLGSIPIRYLHDSTAYLLGEAASGAAKDALSPACVMLGTGLGFAYMRDGRVRIGHDQRPHVILWDSPFRDGIAEDYISRRAIRERYSKAAGGCVSPDVREIAGLAKSGDRAAMETFRVTGVLLAEILYPVLLKLNCDLLVIGGQIARSADLFVQTVQTQLPMPVSIAKHLDDAALYGAARYCSLPHNNLVFEVER